MNRLFQPLLYRDGIIGKDMRSHILSSRIAFRQHLRAATDTVLMDEIDRLTLFCQLFQLGIFEFFVLDIGGIC
jgi:hypothetical protein